MQAVLNLDKDKSHSSPDLFNNVKSQALQVGKKAVLDILTKCFYNNGIKQMVDVMIDIFKTDDNLCFKFMEQCYQEDNYDYLLVLLLECPDAVARLNIANLLKYILNQLKLREKDILYDKETITIEKEDGERFTQERYKALSSRFIMKCMMLLNSYVAKNWSKFDNFLDLLYSFAVGEKDYSKQDEESQKLEKDSEMLGLEFFYRHNFIEKACDFLLGKKSPLIKPGEKRIDMGGTYQTPNFSAIIKLVTRMIMDEEMLEKFPLNELEKKMFL